MRSVYPSLHCVLRSSFSSPRISQDPNPNPIPAVDVGGTAELGYQNVEPLEKPHVSRRSLAFKYVSIGLRLLGLLILPVLAGMCLQQPEKCRNLQILDFYKF